MAVSEVEINAIEAGLDNHFKELAGLPIHKAGTYKYPKSIMLYGPPKTGKTRLMSSIIDVPHVNKVLIVDAEMGSSTVGRHYPDVDIMEIPDTDEGIKSFNKFMGMLVNSPDGLGYDAICLDTLDTLQDMYIRAVCRRLNITKADWDVWDDVHKWTLKILWSLHKMPKLGIVSLHQKMEQDKLIGKLYNLPDLKSGARHRVGSVPDIIGYLDVTDSEKGPIRVLTMSPTERLQTGNRFEEVLPDKLGNPTMKRIYELIDAK